MEDTKRLYTIIQEAYGATGEQFTHKKHVGNFWAVDELDAMEQYISLTFGNPLPKYEPKLRQLSVNTFKHFLTYTVTLYKEPELVLEDLLRVLSDEIGIVVKGYGVDEVFKNTAHNASYYLDNLTADELNLTVDSIKKSYSPYGLEIKVDRDWGLSA